MTNNRVGRMLGKPAGFTLIELLMTLGILSIVLGGIYGFVVRGAESAEVTNNFFQAQGQVRAALDNVVDEARWAQRVVAAAGTGVILLVPQSTPFSTGSPYTVTFAYDAAARTITRQEDPDADGPIAAGTAEAIAYGIVAEDGSAGLTIEYFDGGGVSLGSAPADLTAVARIRFTISATSGDITRTFTGDAALRGG
jgi:prepilin-type N-terminal cleavage/methylation domain-containing protein